MGFKEYTKQFDLSSLGLKQRTSDTANRYNQRMQSMRQLGKTIDSLERETKKYAGKVKQDVFSIFMFSKFLDSGYVKPDISKKPVVKKFEQLIPGRELVMLNQKAGSQIATITLNAELAYSEYSMKQRDLRLHKIEWHKKITLSIACLVLFLIGAPLGSIIRKGGLGTPMVVAVFLFMFYFFFNTAGEKYVKENVMTAFSGMWMATITLVPVGIFLTYKAMHDSQIFNREFYFRMGRRMNKFFKRTK
jgi:lipopolysaccharide export system permease protein